MRILCAGREGTKDAILARTRGDRAEGTRSGYEAEKRCSNIQHPAASRGRLFPVTREALRRSL